MIQVPIYRQTYYYQNPFVNAPPANQFATNTNLDEIHKIYYPDLTDDEFNISDSERNALLYKRGKFEQLAKYGTYQNCGDTYNRVKDNPDFKELVSSKYLNNSQGFVRLINNLNSLESQRQEKLAVYPVQYYGVNVQMVKPSIEYQKYDMKDYLKFLNNFVKNKNISDDLKVYFLYMKSNKLDLYYTKLNQLNDNCNLLDILTEQISYVTE